MMSIQELDYSGIRALNRFAGRSELFDTLMIDLAQSLLLKGGLFMACFWWLWFKTDAAGQPIHRPRIVVSIIGITITALVTRLLQVALPFHSRPLHSADLNFVLPIGVNPQTLNAWNSFPSDHAMLFFAVSTAFWYHSRIAAIVAMIWTTLVICLPRMYLGYHFPSDVIGGAVLGVGLMAGMHPLLSHTTIPGRLVRWEKTNATEFYFVAFVVSFEIAALFGDLRSLGINGLRILKAAVRSLT